MIEVKGDLWTYPASVVVITTNGFVKKNGECVMGRGCALEAKRKNPAIPKMLGDLIRDHGNHVHIIFRGNPLCLSPMIVSFPVKHAWFEKADPALIERSAHELVALADEMKWITLVMPRPGCGNGGLDWDDVRPLIAPILDDRFVVISF